MQWEKEKNIFNSCVKILHMELEFTVMESEYISLYWKGKNTFN